MKRLEKRKHPIKRMFLKKFITSIFFLVFLLVFSFQNFKVEYKPLLESLKKQKLNYSNISETIKSIENTMNENVYQKYKFINVYGYLQQLMDKHEESNFEVVKDNDGLLHYTFFANKPNSVDEIVSRVRAFNDGLKDENKKFIYLMTPDKYIRGYTKFETGIPYNYANETADNFLEELSKNKVDTIDLRKNLDESDIPYNELFFKTDHHWKIQTVFLAFGELVNKLNTDYNINLDSDKFYTNKENYNFITYEECYVGSMGRKTGTLYGGVDDFTLVYPKFKTSYSFYSKNGEQEVNGEGRFEEALLSTSPFRTENITYALEADKYFSYLHGNLGLVHVHNKNNENGPKVLFIKDSLAVPLATFLSTVCSDVYLIDPRYYKEDIPKFANETDLDFIFMSFYPQNLTEEFFPFYKEK